MSRLPKTVKIVVLLLLFLNCKSKKTAITYNSKTLEISPISDHCYLHLSYLYVPVFGNVGCNGLIYVKEGKAIIFDTPATVQQTEELLQWLQKEKQLEVTAVVVNHFHEDALGGLPAFHQAGIPSYASKKTIELAKAKGHELPQIGFDEKLELMLGQSVVENRYFGEAHSPDNIVSYISDDALLFGGCMLKSIGAKKGNLEDANVLEWGATIGRIKQAYPEVEIVVPGHGKVGNGSLLDYTMELFSKN